MTLSLIFGRSGPNYVVVASKGGAPTHPAWYLNLQANPEVKVQVKAAKFTAHTHTADTAERAALWPMMVDIYGPYAACGILAGCGVDTCVEDLVAVRVSARARAFLP